MANSENRTGFVFATSDGLFQLQIDERSREYLLQILTRPFLSISVRKGGCSGYMYSIEESDSFDPEKEYKFALSPKFAVIVNQEDARSILKTLMCQAVENASGITLRWSHQATGNVCGCGESFS